MNPTKIVLTLLLICYSSISAGSDRVSIPLIKPSFLSRSIEGILGKASNPSQSIGPAVIIVHHGGGCLGSQTPQYAKALNAAGYFTLEPCLFATPQSRSWRHSDYLGAIFSSLRYLAQLPNVDRERIAITGGSYGGNFALITASTWAYKNYGDPDLPPFSAHAPFYPSCFFFQRQMVSGKPFPDLPTTLFESLTGASIRIYAGGKDDYEDRDPTSCDLMVKSLPIASHKHITVRLFEDATHGWDQGSTHSFFTPHGCKGRGCQNTNESRPDITQQGIADLIEFLGRAMPAK